jgi:hypothetical protein
VAGCRPPAAQEASGAWAEINAAYDLPAQRAVAGAQARRGPPSAGAARCGGPAAPAERPRRRGDWLPEGVRRALGLELLTVLHRGEDVRLVTPVSVWASPQALLAVTDRRLLWLLDDALTNRVRSLDLPAITGVEVKARLAAAPDRRGAGQPAQRAPADRLRRPAARDGGQDRPAGRRGGDRVMEPFRHTLRVRWGECDEQGVVYFVNYAEYVDLALTELWRERVRPYPRWSRRAPTSWSSRWTPRSAGPRASTTRSTWSSRSRGWARRR